MLTFHMVIRGKVQGVFYRASAVKAASALGITGWVRNMPDGNVEIMATATAQQLEQFTAWCKEGPSGATVEEVTATVTEVREFDAFIIIRN